MGEPVVGVNVGGGWIGVRVGVGTKSGERVGGTVGTLVY